MSWQGPDPSRTPGLEPGGGVPPGETPPGEGGTSAITHQEKGPAPKWVPWAVITALGVVVLMVALLMLVRVFLMASD
ncbi:DUF6480 family protein [Cryptosporangium sp. NPDC051539]|uniref:DUF6480 family protein n=1 Tax=Cryptosporangium sp. NPDC051539 TaxID=3363962 RepID=UPI0037A7F037